MSQQTLELETWSEKALRLAQELKALRAECSFANATTREGMKVHKTARAKREEIERHVREVPPQAPEDS